jgi:hypothetical protein
MAHRTIVGIFESPDAAYHAKSELLGAGIAEERIVVSGCLTDDGIAAEAPGQSFENQPGQPQSDAAAARYGESVRTGACVVSVLIQGADGVSIERLLKINGARHTTDRSLA